MSLEKRRLLKLCNRLWKMALLECKEVPKGNDKKHESKGKRRIFCAHPIFFFFSELGSFHGKLLEYGGDYWCNE